MDSPSQFLITLGSILLLGLFTSAVADRSAFPRVTLLLVFGVVIGAEGMDVIPSIFIGYFELISNMALLLVGFLLGGRLTKETVGELGTKAIWIALCAALAAAAIVSLGLMLVGVSAAIAILLGCIASATAPAAIMDVVTESGVDNSFTRLLLAIVVLDDVIGLVLFGLGLAVVKSINGHGGDYVILIDVMREIGGALMLGVLIGFPAAYLTGRVKPGQPILTEALAIVFLCGGLAIWLGVSFLIASMVMGAVIANKAKHHDYQFHEIEGVESLFLIVFFVLAGASLDLSALKGLGLIGAVYIVCRCIGKIVGARLGGQISHVSPAFNQWIGIALLPQAGVEIGMALVAANQFPEYRQLLLSIVISTSVLFVIVGPIFTRLAIRRASVVSMHNNSG